MGPRTRRLIAAIGALAFLVVYIWAVIAIGERLPDSMWIDLAFYVWAVIAIGERLPDSMWIDLIFYGVAGIAWGVPLIPLFSWAERDGS